MILYGLLCIEILARGILEIRECRAFQMKGGIFVILRLIPLINDIVPLPEKRGAVLDGGSGEKEAAFVREHEKGHAAAHHSVLRNLVKVIFLLLGVWFLAAMLYRFGHPIWIAVLYLHLVAIPFRIFFHFYCWNQEYEADSYALKKLGKNKAKEAMLKLAENEIPYTKLFALVYREHPTAPLRYKNLFKK